MIIYSCQCGESIMIVDNSEGMRKLKKEFKKKHNKGKRNPGHGWVRRKVSKKDMV